MAYLNLLGDRRLRLRAAVVGGILLATLWIAFVWAGTVTSATGGTAISADTAVNGGTGAWSPLSGPVYTETSKNDLGNGTVVLTIPTGFAFDTTSMVSVILQAGSAKSSENINGTTVGGVIATTADGSLTVTPSTISFTISSKSKGKTLDTIAWQGIQVRPLNGFPLASGNITASGSSNIGSAASSTNFGTLTEVAGKMVALLTVLPTQVFTAGTGVTGSASAQTAGNPFNLTQLVASDKFYNPILTYNGAKTIAYTGPSSGCSVLPTYTTNVTFNNGVSTTPLATTLKRAESTTITASDGTVTGPASSSLVVNAAPLSQLVITLPGQTFQPCSGNSGTPSGQSAGVAFVLPSITATDAYFNVIASYAGTKALSYSGPTGSATYTTSVNFSSGQSTTTLTTSIATAQTTTLTVSDGAVTGPASSSFTVAPSVSAFNAFESTTAAGATTGIIKTKIAGSAFGIDVVALTASQTISSGFTGVVKVELVDSSSAGSCTTFPTIQTLPNQTFAASDGGRHTVSGITEANAWKNARVRMSYPVASPTVISCSSDNFAIRPNALSAVLVTDQDMQTAGTLRTLNNTALSGGVVHKAGRPINIKATGQNAAGVTTTGYAGSPVAVLSQCAIGGGVCPATASLGALTLGTWSASAGTVTTNTASYSEVGAFSLVLQDQHFADVDLADSSVAERTVVSAPIDVGRFVPDHFIVTTGTITPRSDIAACSSSSFSYMGEPFGVTFQITAQNAAPANATTVNYSGNLASLNPANPGQLNFGAIDSTTPTPFAAAITAISKTNPGQVTTTTAHGLTTGSQVFVSGVNGMTAVNNQLYTVTVVDPTHFTLGVDTSGFGTYTSGGNASRLSVSASAGTWASGIVSVNATVALQRAVQPDGPFTNLMIGVAPQDADNVQALSFNLDADANGTNERVTLGATQLRFGRLSLKNAYGSEQLNLPVPIEAQFWNGSYFTTNAQDACTSISSKSNVAFANYQGGINAGNMANPANLQLGGAFVAGVGSLILTKPTPTPTSKGSVDVTINLIGENKTYLQGALTQRLFNQNPTSRATFGIYKGGPIIYQREVY